jgi:uncharacterized protein YbjT (DUF2867 family)
MNNKILVIGATGQQGGATARALLTRGRPVHALVRDPASPAARSLADAGATVVTGDLDDRESLRAAMSEVSGVFLVLSMMTGARVSPEGVAAEERRGRTVAELAVETGIEHLVYSSVAGANQHTGIPHIESKTRIEAHLRDLNVPATIVRPAFFMENFATHTKPALVDGELVVSLALRPDTPLQLIAMRDIGALAARAFDHPCDDPVVIAGDSLTGTEIADGFAKARGVPARFEQVPLARLAAFDPEVARMFEWFDSRAGEQADIPLLRSLHPALSTMDDWLVAA